MRWFNRNRSPERSSANAAFTTAQFADPDWTVPYGDTTTIENNISAATTIAGVATALNQAGSIGSYYLVTFSFKTGTSTPATGPGWTGLTSADLAVVKTMAIYYAEEFAKYPKGFVVDALLGTVNLGKTILYNGSSGAAAFAFNQNIYEALPSTAATDPDNWRRVIHHEFWHVVDGAFPTVKDAQEAQWREDNGTGYLYTSRGGTLRANQPDGHPISFIDATSQQNYSEDRAQIHSALMAQPRYSQLKSWMTNDPDLTDKVNLIKAECTDINPFMSGTYWEDINPHQKWLDSVESH